MSRLSTMSPAALRALFSPNADDTLVTLLTVTGAGLAEPIRLADNFDQRLSETDEDVLYGIVSRGEQYMFLPMEVVLPSDEEAAAPRASIVLHDVTRILIPTIRTLTEALEVTIELVLKSTPDVVEASFPGFFMSHVPYNADAITVQLDVESLAAEPFPCHTMTPSYFPGLF